MQYKKLTDDEIFIGRVTTDKNYKEDELHSYV